MSKFFFTLLLSVFLLPAAAQAQSSPGLIYGQVPTPSQWNGYFSAKMDYSGAGIPVSGGGTGATTAAAARANLGIGSVGIYPIGTSGVAVPLLSMANTWSTHQTLEGITPTGATGTGNMVFSNSPVLVTPALGNASGGTLNLTGAADAVDYKNNGVLTISHTAPTFASGACTSPSAVTANGTAAFSIVVGTGCSGSQPIVFTLPAAAHSWSCHARDVSTGTDAPKQTGALSTTSVTITNYIITTGIAGAWTDNDVVEVGCIAY